jgi:hypothetical protein
VKVGIDGGLDPSFRERKLSDSLNLVTDPDTPPAKDTFVSISLDKGRTIVSREGDLRPGVLGLLHAVFVDQILEFALPFLFTTRTGHGMVQKNKLKLKPAGGRNRRRPGDDLRSRPGGGEASRQEFRIPLLLDDADATGPEGDQPAVVAERGDPDPRGLGCVENGLTPFDLNLDIINLQFDRLTGHNDKIPGIMECWNNGIME